MSGPEADTRIHLNGVTTMKFLMLLKASEKFREQGPPPELFEAMGKFVQDSFQSGKIVDTGGLLPTSAATQLRVENGKLTVKDGPFTEAKEVVGGWAISKVDSKAEAVEHARKFMELHRENWPGWEGTSEVYQMEEYG
jgi:hypothetical protein